MKEWSNYSRKKNVKSVYTLWNVKIRVDNSIVIKLVNYTTLWNPYVFELLTI